MIDDWRQNAMCWMLIGSGASAQAIAESMGISEHAVRVRAGKYAKELHKRKIAVAFDARVPAALESLYRLHRAGAFLWAQHGAWKP